MIGRLERKPCKSESILNIARDVGFVYWFALGVFLNKALHLAKEGIFFQLLILLRSARTGSEKIRKRRCARCAF
jgi:rRNA processing protein Krr1/Pno1